MRTRPRVGVSMKTITSTALLLFALSTIWIQPAAAQSQDEQKQDIQQLKDKLQQLDQMMNEVRGEIRSLEGAQGPPVAPAVGQNPPASEGPVIAVPSEAVISTPPAGTVPLEGEITERKDTVNFYGFAMLDSGYDFGQVNPNWYDVVRPTQLPSFHNEFAPSGNVYAGVRQTRFGVKSSTPTQYGDLNTIFEFELFGTGVDAGQTTFRLRHAWGEMGQFGAGQTWSPFMDINVFPNSIEYWGPNGMVFFRNVQFRWTPIKTAHNTFMIAAERPGASADQGVYGGRIELSNITPQFILPDLSMQAHFDRKWGYLQ